MSVYVIIQSSYYAVPNSSSNSALEEKFIVLNGIKINFRMNVYHYTTTVFCTISTILPVTHGTLSTHCLTTVALATLTHLSNVDFPY